MRDLTRNLGTVLMMVPKVVNDDTEGTPTASLDLQGYNSGMVVLAVGDSGDTLSGSVKFDVVAQHSDDNTAWTAITDANDVVGVTLGGSGIIATIDAPTEDQVIVKAGYVGPKRYFRLLVDMTGTHTNGTPMAMVGLRGNSLFKPAA